MNEKPPIVTKADERPANTGKGECFYCQNKIGQHHNPECVIWKRTVLVRATIEYPITVPHFWNKESIVFHRNDSSWCADNMLEELDIVSTDTGCLCPLVTYEYVKEIPEEEV